MIIPKLVLMNAHKLANRLVLRLPLPEAKGLEGRSLERRSRRRASRGPHGEGMLGSGAA